MDKKSFLLTYRYILNVHYFPISYDIGSNTTQLFLWLHSLNIKPIFEVLLMYIHKKRNGIYSSINLWYTRFVSWTYFIRFPRPPFNSVKVKPCTLHTNVISFPRPHTDTVKVRYYTLQVNKINLSAGVNVFSLVHFKS